jgi:hypothetical protein
LVVGTALMNFVEFNSSERWIDDGGRNAVHSKGPVI